MKEFLTFKEVAVQVLKDSASPLTVAEIWEEARRRKLDKRLRSIGRTPEATLYSDLHRTTQDGAESEFVRVGSRPRRYWLQTRAGEGGAAVVVPPPLVDPMPPAQSGSSGASLLLAERDIHPLLAWFANDRMGGVLVKTILHEKSKKKTFGEWVHPDLVGVLFPRRALDNELTLRLSAALSAPLCRIFSFELKLQLDFSNLREAFFQAVSNSSWAHEAYLVAASVDDSPEFQDELERLCMAFGVGVIELPIDDVMSSGIRRPARARPELDWATVDKLAEMNPDFAAFLKNVTDDLKTDIHPKEYDRTLDDPLRYLDDRRASAPAPRSGAVEDSSRVG